MNNKVSVLMGVYNTPLAYLEEAIDSIINQTYKDIELIIVDDCSTDADTIRYLKRAELECPQIKLIRNFENLGLTKSLNIGINLCKGTYIARMDSDDISMPTRLEKQVDYLEQHSDVALVGSDKITFGVDIDEYDGSLDRNRIDDYELYRIRSLLQHSGPAHPSFMFRKQFLDDNEIRYREDILKAQDYGIMVDIFKAGGKISKIKESLIKYRIHGGQISTTSELEQKAYQSRVSFDYIKFLFPEMADAECTAISMLGNDYSAETLIEAVNDNESLSEVCFHIRNNADLLTDSGTYVRALKDIIKLNHKKNIFDEKKFETELRYEWWRKYLETYKTKHKLWGLSPYSLYSRKYAVKVRKEL